MQIDEPDQRFSTNAVAEYNQSAVDFEGDDGAVSGYAAQPSAAISTFPADRSAYRQLPSMVKQLGRLGNRILETWCGNPHRTRALFVQLAISTRPHGRCHDYGTVLASADYGL
jgi:hypothetical protein